MQVPWGVFFLQPQLPSLCVSLHKISMLMGADIRAENLCK
jgi:hypothetical protein